MADTPFPGFSRATLDDALVNPEVYSDPNEIHALYTRLRAEDPLHWTQPRGFRPFWSVTRHADIHAISKANDVFINRKRTYLSPIEGEEWVLQTVGDTHLFRTLVDLDDPEHRKLRQLTHDWFLPGNVKKLEPRIRDIARTHVDRMLALGGECDFVNEVALWYPLRVIMMLLGVPAEDEPLMLKMTQEIFGPGDPDVVARSTILTSGPGAFGGGTGDRQVDLFALAQQFAVYFNALTEDRRRNPRDDVATIISNGMIDGQPIGEREAISYYAIIATAGHDTTSSTAAGGLLALLQNPDQLARLKADLSLLPTAVEEMIRWVTPVKHFMRTATRDYPLRGRIIREGEAVTLFYWSGNRDEEVFADPFQFRIDRSPNPQIAFGHGVHLCLGMHLARLEIRILFEELLPRLAAIDLAGEPKWTRANFVSGLKSLPVRYKLSA
jgi:hypothetical protein